MKKFIRENPTIAFGLGLPLLVALMFLLVSGIPALLVDDPQYDVLYATEYYDNLYGVQISVIENKVQVVYQGNLQTNSKPKIWLYNAKTGAVKEIAYMLPPGLLPTHQPARDADAVAQTTVIDVPDLAGLRVDSSSIAPDGYEFQVGGNRYSGNVFDGLFYSSRYRNEAVLSKNGRIITLPRSDNRYYGYDARLIGWVMPQ